MFDGPAALTALAKEIWEVMHWGVGGGTLVIKFCVLFYGPVALMALTRETWEVTHWTPANSYLCIVQQVRNITVATSIANLSSYYSYDRAQHLKLTVHARKDTSFEPSRTVTFSSFLKLASVELFPSHPQVGKLRSSIWATVSLYLSPAPGICLLFFNKQWLPGTCYIKDGTLLGKCSEILSSFLSAVYLL